MHTIVTSEHKFRTFTFVRPRPFNYYNSYRFHSQNPRTRNLRTHLRVLGSRIANNSVIKGGPRAYYFFSHTWLFYHCNIIPNSVISNYLPGPIIVSEDVPPAGSFWLEVSRLARTGVQLFGVGYGRQHGHALSALLVQPPHLPRLPAVPALRRRHRRLTSSSSTSAATPSPSPSGSPPSFSSPTPPTTPPTTPTTPTVRGHCLPSDS